MRSVLTPSIARLINSGKEVIFGDGKKEDVINALNEAEKSGKEYKALFILLSTCFYREKETKTLIEYLESNFNEQEKNFNDLRNVLERNSIIELNPVLHKITETAGRLTSGMRELKDFEDKQDIESPIPVVNACIKASYNFAQGTGDIFMIENWIPSIFNLINRLESEINRFKTLHSDESKLTAAFEKLLKDMKDGAGALFSFLKNRNPVSLADGLRLLKYPSRNIYILLSEMDRLARASGGFSKNPALSEFYQSYSRWKDGKANWSVVVSSLDSLKTLAKLYDDVHTGMKAFPFFFSIQNSWAAAQINKIQFHGFFSQFLNSFESKQTEPDFVTLKTHFENYSQIIERLISNMEEEVLKVSSAPHIEELKELIGRALNDAVVVEYFSEKMHFFSEKHKEILFEFKKGLESNSNDPVLKEVFNLLTLQGDGLNKILAYFECFEKKNLYDGLLLIEKPLPRLIEIRKNVKEAIDEKISSTRQKKFVCIKCGTENSSQMKKCVKCSAVLHFSVPDNNDFDNMVYEDASPLNIAKIENAVKGFEEGAINADDVEKHILSYLSSLDAISTDFEKRAKPVFLSSKNSSIREWTETFSRNLASMRQALQTMLLFKQTPELLYQGIQALQASASELSEIRRLLGEKL